MNTYKQWLATCEKAGIPAISTDTCCRLLAIVYVIGGSMEAFTFNRRLAAEWQYASRRFGIEDGATPDGEAAVLIQQYVAELQQYYKTAPADTSGSPLAVVHPQWVRDLMTTRYGITKLWI